jgi:putative DNA primase/helicase
MSFTPSPQQAAAIGAIVDWYRDPHPKQPVFRLFGYAGSGKSTITRHVIEALGLAPMSRDGSGQARPPAAPQVRHDVDAIVAQLRATAHSWVPRLFPNGRRAGDEWRLANIKGAAPRKQGSCVIALRGPHAGDWHEFDGGVGGGPISAIAEATGLAGADLIAEAAGIAGIAPGAPQRRAPAAPARQKRDPAQEIAHILAYTTPAADTPVAAYLVQRGLALPAGADLLFHADLTHWETKTGYPAMVAQVRDRDGAVIGLHRTYLDVATGAVEKASVASPKMMLGRIAGGAVRLAELGDGDRLALSEGIESGLAVMTACPGFPVWATLSTSGLEQVVLPPGAKRVIILADHDASGAGLRAAETSARRLRGEGREVSIALPPQEGHDFNDLLLRDGPGAVRDVIEAALRPAPVDDLPPLVGQHRPLNYAIQDSALPMMRADEGDLARAVERAWSLLLASNRTPWLFRYAGIPNWVVPDDEGRPVAVALTDERLRHMLARLADWRRLNAKGELVPSHPPTALVKSILATPDPGLPVLVGIVSAPVFGRHGRLLTTPGYHPDARLLYCPAPGFEVPAIPERPSAAEIAAARQLICDDLLGDFPFVSEAERAHAVALLLLGFLRSMVDGPTPLHLIEKPTPGTGATLMVDAIATILTGAGASVMTEGRDDEEWRKRVTAKLRQVPSIVLIDNLRNKLDSAAVAAALTAPFWEDRILGASEMARLPIRCLWIATGNNPEFSNEMARRIVRIRLDAHVERPWQRAGFRHPDLMTWVRANRAPLVGACLTLCQAWIAAGRPRGMRTIGSYENWAQVIGGVLEVAGIGGFLGNLEEMMRASDSEGPVWRSFVAAWWDRLGTAEVGTANLYEVALFCEPPLQLGPGNDQSRRIRLGKALVRLRDRVFHLGPMAVRVQACGTLQNAQRWQLAIDEQARMNTHNIHRR